MGTVVAALVVTHNRRALLEECLAGLASQTMRPDAIVVVDNASTDDSMECLNGCGIPGLEVLSMPVNVGGAGGFHAGLKHCHEKGFDAVWLMDDDTVPASDALERLMAANDRLRAKGLDPSVLASRVDWIDGGAHPMNYPQIKRKDWDLIYSSLSAGVLPLRSASFVSLLVFRRAIDTHGYPIASYFIWNDDVEYVARITRQGYGALVPDSRAVHKTIARYTPLSSSGDRFFYEVRNKLWMVTWSDAFSAYERLRYLLVLGKGTGLYLWGNRLAPRAWLAVMRGVFSGLFRRPT